MHFQGKQLSHFHFCFPCQCGSTLKEKNLLLLEQILSVKSRSILERLHHAGKQRESLVSCFPLLFSLGEKHMKVYSYTIKILPYLP